MDTTLLGYLAIGASGGYLAGKLSDAPWAVLTLGILGLSAAYFVESGGTGLPYPDTNPDPGADSGGGDTGNQGDDPAGASAADMATIFSDAIAYARHYGYTITDRGGLLDGHLMFCEPLGAVALHATLGTCAWKYCDVLTVASQRLGQSEQWVSDFHAGFHHDTSPGLDQNSEGYQAGLSYRGQYLPGAV
jgi:hypothetical protein